MCVFTFFRSLDDETVLVLGSQQRDIMSYRTDIYYPTAAIKSRLKQEQQIALSNRERLHLTLATFLFNYALNFLLIFPYKFVQYGIKSLIINRTIE